MNECSICLEELTGNIVILNCKHRYHDYCIGNWFDNTMENMNKLMCPECNIETDIHDTIFVDEMDMLIDENTSIYIVDTNNNLENSNDIKIANMLEPNQLNDQEDDTTNNYLNEIMTENTMKPNLNEITNNQINKITNTMNPNLNQITNENLNENSNNTMNPNLNQITNDQINQETNDYLNTYKIKINKRNDIDSNINNINNNELINQNIENTSKSSYFNKCSRNIKKCIIS